MGAHRAWLEARPDYDVLMNLIKGKWWTKAEAPTDAEGRAGFRAMCGQYRVTAKRGDRTTSSSFTVRPGVENKLELRLSD